MTSSVFVTGGSGYVGRHVVNLLVNNISHKPWDSVKVLARSSSSAEIIKRLGAVPVRGDLLGADDSWKEELIAAKYFMHCAQPDLGDSCREDMEQILLNTMAKSNVKRAVFCYGSSYFGTNSKNKLMDEADQRTPIGLGSTMEPCLINLHNTTNLDWVAAFPGGIYGKGSWFMDMFTSAIKSGEPIILSNKPTIWPFVHINDCARALVYLLTVDDTALQKFGREYMVVDDQPDTLDNFVDELAKALDLTANKKPMEKSTMEKIFPLTMVNYLTSNMNHSNSLIKKLGFEFSFSNIKSGIGDLID